jgi:hypothetical protein
MTHSGLTGHWRHRVPLLSVQRPGQSFCGARILREPYRSGTFAKASQAPPPLGAHAQMGFRRKAKLLKRRSNTSKDAAPSAGRSAIFRACAGKSPRCTGTSKLRTVSSTGPAPAPTRSPTRCWRGSHGDLQRDGAQGNERGDPGAWRQRLHRRVPGIALLPGRPLRHARRGHQRDAARPDRPEGSGRH